MSHVISYKFHFVTYVYLWSHEISWHHMMILFGKLMTVDTSIPIKTFNNTRWHSNFWGWWKMRDCLATSEAIFFFVDKILHLLGMYFYSVRSMMFNATYNNISVISWQSVSLVEETGLPGKNKRPVACHWKTLSHNVVSSTPCHKRDSISQH